MDNFIVWAILIALYFIPTFIAAQNKHKGQSAIFIVNLLFGWTIIGWLWALIWANTGNVEDGPTPDTHIKCPDCAELILKDARVCKHCGCRLAPQ